jgi:hypothetical protein
LKSPVLGFSFEHHKYSEELIMQNLKSLALYLAILTVFALFIMAHARAEDDNSVMQQQMKPVICKATKALMTEVQDKYGEEPQWFGEDDDSHYVVMMNHKTKTWTWIQYNEDLACVLGYGQNVQKVHT